MAALLGREVVHETSYYDGCRRDLFNPCGLTSSGEVFNPWRADNAASPIYPDGTTLLVYNPDTGRAAVLRVNNAGPYWGRRKLDVSRATAVKLGFRKHGIAKLQVMVIGIPTDEETRYHRRRRYQKVPGPIGEYASLDDARRAISGRLLTASARYTGMRPSDLFRNTKTGSEDATPRTEHLEPVAVATVEPGWGSVARIETRTEGRSALSALVRPFVTAALPPVGHEAAETANVPAVPHEPEVHDGNRDAEPRAQADHSKLAALHLQVDPTDATRELPTPQPADVARAEGPSASTQKPAPDIEQPQPELDGRAPTNRPIELVATRRLDILAPDQQAQPAHATLPLDVAVDLMERDLSAGRVTLFAQQVRLKTLERKPVGRLSLFARAAEPTPPMTDGHRSGVARYATRISDRIRWQRFQATLVTNAVMPEPGH